MPAQYVTSIVEGQDFYVSDIDPTGVVSAPRGSICLRTDNGNALIYYNVTTGAAPGTGTTWVPLLTTDWTDIGTQITLLDNANPALQVGPAGFLDLLKFITTNGAEQIVMRSSAAPVQITGGNGLNFSAVAATITAPAGGVSLLNIAANAQSPAVSPDRLGATVQGSYAVPANGGGAPVNTDFALSTTRNVKVLDAFVISAGGGGAGQTVQVRTLALGAITDAMTLSATVNGVTRAGILNGATIAPGDTLRFVSAATTVACTAVVIFAVL